MPQPRQDRSGRSAQKLPLQSNSGQRTHDRAAIEQADDDVPHDRLHCLIEDNKSGPLFQAGFVEEKNGFKGTELRSCAPTKMPRPRDQRAGLLQSWGNGAVKGLGTLAPLQPSVGGLIEVTSEGLVRREPLAPQIKTPAWARRSIGAVAGVSRHVRSTPAQYQSARDMP
jgi:hypothetical protein